MTPDNQSVRFCYLIVLQNRQRRCRKASLAISLYIILLNHILEYPFPEEWVFYFISVTSEDVAFLA